MIGLGRVYTVLLEAVSVSAAKDLIRITAHTNRTLVPLRAWLTQEASETSEQLPLILQRASTDGTGTSFTARKHCESDAVFGGTAVTNLSADTTAGDVLWREAQNVLNGWLYHPIPEERKVVTGAGRIVMRLPTAPAAALTLTGGITFAEIG